MKNRNITYCILFIFLSLTDSCKKSNVLNIDKKIIIYHTLGNDTIGIDTLFNYKMSSIAESCQDIHFSDSMLGAWNQASISNITRDNSKYLDDCLKLDLQYYQQADNFRLEFSKKVLNNFYLEDSDFERGFYIIEEVYESSYIGTRYYLIISRENELKSYIFEFVNSYSSFFLRYIETLNKERFKNFYESFIKQDKNEMTMYYRKFNVTYFYQDKIDSYISGCKMCISCIEEFKNMLREK